MSDLHQVTLEQQLGSFLNIASDRIQINNKSAIVHCCSDDEIVALTNEWATVTLHFCDRINYLVLHKDDYQRSLPLNKQIWQPFDQSLEVQPT